MDALLWLSTNRAVCILEYQRDCIGSLRAQSSDGGTKLGYILAFLCTSRVVCSAPAWSDFHRRRYNAKSGDAYARILTFASVSLIMGVT